jgi:hypothetical protein
MQKGVKIQIPKSLNNPKIFCMDHWKNNQPILIVSCIENIKKNFFAGLRPALMQDTQK